ncbi:MAG: hypothetical protein WCF69_06370 [Mycobacterium sp.]
MPVVFACQSCAAVPELLVDCRAQLSIFRHAAGCPTLLAQLRTRAPEAMAGAVWAGKRQFKFGD